MATAEETESADARVGSRVGLKIASPDAEGHVELVRTSYGADLVLDGHVLASLDLYYRSESGKEGADITTREDCALLCLGFSEHDYVLGVYMTKPDLEGKAKMAVVRERHAADVIVYDNIPVRDAWVEYESLSYEK